MLDTAVAGLSLGTIDTRLFEHGDEDMIPRSGDHEFDLALAQTLAKISDGFGVLPGFAYYNDSDGKNAYATPQARLQRADGTVLFGQGMLQQLMNGTDHPELAVATVCAHEFGHVVQFKHHINDQLLKGEPTVKRAELNADFLAGYFAGRRKLERSDFPAAVFAETQYDFGDMKFNNESHHGTPKERAEAVVQGFRTAFSERRSFDDALQIGVNYVLAL